MIVFISLIILLIKIISSKFIIQSNLSNIQINRLLNETKIDNFSLQLSNLKEINLFEANKCNNETLKGIFNFINSILVNEIKYNILESIENLIINNKTNTEIFCEFINKFNLSELFSLFTNNNNLLNIIFK